MITKSKPIASLGQTAIPTRQDTYAQFKKALAVTVLYLLCFLAFAAAEFGISIQLFVRILGIGNDGTAIGKFEGFSFAIGIALSSYIIKHFYERFCELDYLNNARSVAHKTVIGLTLLLGLVTFWTFGEYRAAAYAVKKASEQVYSVRNKTKQAIYLRGKAGATEAELKTIAEDGRIKEKEILDQLGVASLEAAWVSFYSGTPLKYTFILSGLLVAILSGICLARASVNYKILALSHRLGQLHKRLGKRIGEYHAAVHKAQKLEEYTAKYEQLQEDRAIFETLRTQALATLRFEMGKSLGSDFQYELQDLKAAYYKRFSNI